MRLWAKQGTHLFSEQQWEGCRQQTLRRESCSKSGGCQHVSTASQPGDGSHHGGEAPASGTQKVQQEFTMCKALKENPGRKRMQAHSPTDSGNRSRVTLKRKNVGGHVTIVRHQDFQITCTALSPSRVQVECLFHRVCFAQQCNILMILCMSFISYIY